AAASFVDRAEGYGVVGEQCDGNDVFAVYDMVQRAAARARNGEGASLLEVMTYRRKGHAEHDAQAYVPDGEIASWEAKDPVTRYEQRLLADGHATQDELEAIVRRVNEEVEQAREAAEMSPMPEPETALAEVTDGTIAARPWTRYDSPDPRRA
ncbi:MAG: thiamine pyrophosphate-dependent enzyme, partial [Longimicrobiales bacterium]